MILYFYPGLGADSNLAPFHAIPGFEIRWIDWPGNLGGSWEGFILELKKENRYEPGSVHIGISFGGLVAQRMAYDTEGKGLILIGSLTSVGAIGWVFRILLRAAALLPGPMFEITRLPRFVARRVFGISEKAHLDLFYRMASKLSGKQVRTLIGYISAATGQNPPACPILRLHGRKDRILPFRNQAVDLGIEDGGHLVSMTNSNEINGILMKWLAGKP